MHDEQQGKPVARPAYQRLKRVGNALLDGGFSIGFGLLGWAIAIPAEVVIRDAAQELRDLGVIAYLMAGTISAALVMVVVTFVFLSLISPALGLVLGGLGLARASGRNRRNAAGLWSCDFIGLLIRTARSRSNICQLNA